MWSEHQRILAGKCHVALRHGAALREVTAPAQIETVQAAQPLAAWTQQARITYAALVVFKADAHSGQLQRAVAAMALVADEAQAAA